MSDKRPSHRRSNSWGDGVQLTQDLLVDIIPYACAEETTVESVTRAFHHQNQRFLKEQILSQRLPPTVLVPPPPSPLLKRELFSRPPLYSSSGLSAGRDILKPILDDAPKDNLRRLQSSSKSESSSFSIDNSVFTLGSGGYSGDDNWSIESKNCEPEDIQTCRPAPPLKQHVSPRENQASIPPGEDKAKEFIRKYRRELQVEKARLMDEWREEFRREDDTFQSIAKGVRNCFWEPLWNWLTVSEVFISNLPLTIGAVGLSWVTQGVVWFKFMEENIDSCRTVRFNSPQCTFAEFPGCFQCNTSNEIYKFTIVFHYFCHIVAATCCLLFLTKCILAWKTVVDELSNPATATPVGVVCITLICVAAGRGTVGEVIVICTSIFHVLLSFWFLYIAIFKFRLWPDPGWFPNTVGIAYASIKTWLYFPVPGLAIMVLCMVYLFFTFPIALYRAFYNHKISAPVCFISLSAPSITMYAMTILAQSRPSGEVLIESDPEFASLWREEHTEVYIPLQDFMMVLSLIGFASSIHCLWARWPNFKTKAFSPAHVAFIFPVLSHTNAVQAYRSGFNSFSNDPMGSPFHIALFSYWFVCLICGTTLNLYFTYKYICCLPTWTKIDETVLEEEIAPSPMETFTYEMMEEEAGAHEVLNQSFTSPAVLQANEAGTLVRVRRGTQDYNTFGPYVRTRNVTSVGFDPMLTDSELRQERAELLDWVAKNAPRTRNRTLSIPQTFKLGESSQVDAYGTFPSRERNEAQANNEGSHRRSFTWGSWAFNS